MTEPAILLRIVVGENDRFEHRPLYLEILERARRLGLAGCTVTRGIAGFGASSVLHADRPFKLSHDLPLILELVDSREQVEKILSEIGPLLDGALVIEEDVRVMSPGPTMA